MSSVNVTAGFGTLDNVAEVAEPAATNLARLSLGLEGLMERAARACPEVSSGMRTPNPARLSLGLSGLMERAVQACPEAASRMRTPDRSRLALGLEGLMERAAQACPEAAASPVVDFAFGGKWLAAHLRDGLCGRAFTFM